MSAAICPYCRAEIEPDPAQAVYCPGCGTPHHVDCFEENGGCTIFGCSAAPPAESKLSIGSPDLYSAVITRAVPPALSVPGPPPPPLIGSTGAPPPPMPRQATLPPAGEPEPPMFNSWGYSLLAHPLPNPEPGAAPLFSSLGYGPPRAIPSPALRPGYIPTSWAVDPALPQKNRITYMLLGVLLGALGAHSFYAGTMKKGFVQLGITLLSLGFAGLMVWIWAIIDICTISTDNDGIPFRN